MRRTVGCLLISFAVVLRAFVLEAHPPPVNVEFYMIIGIWSLAPIMLLVSLVVFVFLGISKKINLADNLFDFLFCIFGWALSGLLIASLIIILGSAYYASPQGPFSIIFIDGPLGVGVGTVFGLLMWLLTVRNKNTSLKTSDQG